MPADAVADNKTVLRGILLAYGQADLGNVISAFDPDVQWLVHAQTGHYRFGGPRRGHLGMTEVWAMLATYFTIERYDVVEIVGEGDVLWATNDLIVRARKTERRMNIRLVNRWEFRNGKVIACEEYFDTAGALAKQDRIANDIADEAS